MLLANIQSGRNQLLCLPKLIGPSFSPFPESLCPLKQVPSGFLNSFHLSFSWRWLTSVLLPFFAYFPLLPYSPLLCSLSSLSLKKIISKGPFFPQTDWRDPWARGSITWNQSTRKFWVRVSLPQCWGWLLQPPPQQNWTPAQNSTPPGEKQLEANPRTSHRFAQYMQIFYFPCALRRPQVWAETGKKWARCWEVAKNNHVVQSLTKAWHVLLPSSLVVQDQLSFFSPLSAGLQRWAVPH